MFVDISGGLHASEIAGSQNTIQLAYDLLGHSDDPKVKAILDNTVLFVWPSINPDGQNIVVNCIARTSARPTKCRRSTRSIRNTSATTTTVTRTC